MLVSCLTKDPILPPILVSYSYHAKKVAHFLQETLQLACCKHCTSHNGENCLFAYCTSTSSWWQNDKISHVTDIKWKKTVLYPLFCSPAYFWETKQHRRKIASYIYTVIFSDSAIHSAYHSYPSQSPVDLIMISDAWKKE